MSAGKGDKPRKVDIEKFSNNYDAIFRKTNNKASKKKNATKTK